MAISLSEEELLSEAFSIIEHTPDTQVVIDKLRDLLKVDHAVYYLPKLGSAPFIRLTYPASWIKRYLQMDYAKIDPISREGAQRTQPFDWNELKIQSSAEASFLADALTFGVGPHGLSIPLSDRGHRALFSISFSGSEQEWRNFLATTRRSLIQIANRLHSRIVIDLFGKHH
jgi:LuxR family transcriptional regulator, quorum-sensing system regulator CinR